MVVGNLVVSLHIPQEEFQDLLEEYQNTRVEGYCPAEWDFIDWLIVEVKKQRDMRWYYRITGLEDRLYTEEE